MDVTADSPLRSLSQDSVDKRCPIAGTLLGSSSLLMQADIHPLAAFFQFNPELHIARLLNVSMTIG
jgi:hypothetical protein